MLKERLRFPEKKSGAWTYIIGISQSIFARPLNILSAIFSFILHQHLARLILFADASLQNPTQHEPSEAVSTFPIDPPTAGSSALTLKAPAHGQIMGIVFYT
jgi:hypothetical protein